jgi:hypothetical protein
MNGSRIYDLASVQDCGAYWKVTNVYQNSIDNIADANEKVLRLSYMSNQLIKEALLDNKVVHIHKAMMTLEVLPGEFDIIDPKNNDELQATKDAVIAKIRVLVTPEFSKVSGLTIYGFTVLNNDLANAGFFITNENREEKYLEILETGDEKLISKLEDYLNYKDEIENIAYLERMFSKYKSDVKQASTVEEVQSLEAAFLGRLYSSLQ